MESRLMNILHIVNDYNHTKVHKNLIGSFDKLKFSQTVYIPLRRFSDRGNNEFEFSNSNSNFIYSDLLKKSHRFLFRRKISFLFNYLIKNLNVESFDIVHASTLYSDGALAYRLFCKFGIPYVVTVRNTDLFTFHKIRKDLIFLVRKILKHASKIVFISEANRKYFFSLGWSNSSEFLAKSIVINNGIDEFWLNNIKQYNFLEREVIRGVYVGRFDDNKNVMQLINAIELFNERSPIKIALTLVGASGQQHEEVVKYSENNSWVEYLGQVNDKDKLLNIFRSSSFFIMISKKETFGLVYIEALSQGLPIVYTKNQGVDGLTTLKIGEGTDLVIEDIQKSLTKIISEDYSDINKLDFSNFSWIGISEKYSNIYLNIRNEKA